MMSQPHPQPRRLAQSRNQLPDQPESSSSTSQSAQKHFSHSLIQTSTTTTTTTNSSSHSSFGSKLVSSFSHQNLGNHQNLTIPCCFYVSSRRWNRLKLGYCGEVSSMASQGDILVHTPLEIRKKKLSGQQKREHLEREVSVLQKMLNQEEKMHEILEQVHNQHNSSAISIPNFLPPKMKELLAELAMVESEIVRLEGQISQLQIGLKHEQEVTKKSKTKQWEHGNLGNPLSHSSFTTNPNPSNKGGNERMTYETRALHFISKAIKGDYNLKDLRGISDQKENHFHEAAKVQDKVPSRKSVILKPPSPLREPRHSSPKPKDRNPAILLDLVPKMLSNAIQSEDENQQWQPNKLSESIMKCLNFIYVRLLRTSRAMELEKSGPISRSMNSSFSSRSFRVETGLKSGLLLQKELRQQDPYGIFDMEESIPRDIGPYKNLVVFTSNSLDPKSIPSSSSIPLLRKLRVLMNNLQTVDLRSLSNQHKLAFWINMYNACIMHGFIQYGVPSTPEKLLTLMNKATLNIGGNIINAQAIEHFILRKPASSNMREVHRKGENDDKESIVREIYGLESMDPNVTFALCCGTRSSPAVRVYTGDGVIAELEKSKLDYLQASVVVSSTKRIALPELLLRNMLDFAVDTDSLLEWVCHQLPTSGSLRKSMVDCFRGHNNVKISSNVGKIPYDFEFQYLLAI